MLCQALLQLDKLLETQLNYTDTIVCHIYKACLADFQVFRCSSNSFGLGETKLMVNPPSLDLAGLGSVQYFVQLYIEEAF